MVIKKKKRDVSSSSTDSSSSGKSTLKHHIRHHLIHNPPKPRSSLSYDKKLVHESNIFFFGALSLIFCSLAVLARDLAIGAVGLLFSVSVFVEYIKFKKVHKLDA